MGEGQREPGVLESGWGQCWWEEGGGRRVKGLRNAPSNRTKAGKPDRLFTSLEIKIDAAKGLTREAGR